MKICGEFGEREEQLKKIINGKKRSITNMPEGVLRINKSKGRYNYYCIKDNSSRNGEYIPKVNIQLAAQLAQKSYDQKVLKAAERELVAIERYRAWMPEYKVEDIYECLHPERQKLVVPVEEPIEEFIAKWEAVEYKRKEFGDNDPVLMTVRGERVRSKSEIIISDMLYNAGIPYRYEYPLHLEGFGVVHPDFTVLNTSTRQEIYWEHFGKLDDGEYMGKNARKLNAYEENGFYLGEKLIITYETKKMPLDQRKIKRMIQRYFE